MKKLLIILLALMIGVAVFFMVLGYKSQTGSAPGLIKGQLKECPDTPNCVTSDIKTDDEHFVAPLSIQGNTTGQVLKKMTAIIRRNGGEILVSQDNYIAATFSSPLFQFVDDFEIRIDTTQQKIHFRSASRVGKSDLGANLKRIKDVQENYIKGE